MDKIKVFLSLPMSGFRPEEISESINKMKSIYAIKKKKVLMKKIKMVILIETK